MTTISARGRGPLDDRRRGLVEANLGLAHHLARRSVGLGRRMEYDDLVQEAVLGLIDASGRWDESLGIPFGTYAQKAVVYHLVRSRGGDGLIRLPEHTFRPPRRAGERAWSSTTSPALKVLARRARDVASLDMADPDAGPGMGPIARSLPAEAGRPGERDDDVEALAGHLRRLGERERDILARRFDRGQTLEEVGLDLGISRQRIWQIEAKALGRLRVAYGIAPAGPSAADRRRADRAERASRAV